MLQKNGSAFRDLLRMKSRSARDAMEVYVTQGGSLPKPLPEPWGVLPDLVESRFAAGAALNAQNWVDAYDHLAHCLTTFVSAFAVESSWCLPAFLSICVDVRLLAQEADNFLRSTGEKPGRLEEAERILKRGFTTTNNDRREIGADSRRVGTLGAINQLLKVYFKLNNLRLCGNLTRTVDSKTFPSFEAFPVGHRVTYKYFTGRLHLYEDRYADAVRDLSYSLANMQRTSIHHRRKVLLYLIPAKILTGVLPSTRMLEDNSMVWFRGITEAITTGNLRVFDDAVSRHEEFFIRKALYLAVEKMRPLVYRSLCKRVAKICASNKIALEKIRISLKTCGAEMDRDEVECILANLIYNNYIKGYISHKVGYLVLSKKNPFPRVRS